jgi:hypothetical protein
VHLWLTPHSAKRRTFGFNQRLHSVVAKPYGSETERTEKAVAIGQLIIEVLAQTGDFAPAKRTPDGYGL